MLLYKYRSVTNVMNLFDILMHERLYCAKYMDLNDPFEGQFMAVLQETTGAAPVASKPPLIGKGRLTNDNRIEFRDIEKACGYRAPRICSLSRNPNDVRMWSLYTESHQGVAIEIDFSGIEDQVGQVIYHKALPKHGDVKHPDPRAVLLRKTMQWEYEDEFRILLDKGNEVYFDVSRRIKRVLLGARTSDAMKEMLLKVVPSHIGIVQMELDYVEGHVVEGGVVRYAV